MMWGLFTFFTDLLLPALCIHCGAELLEPCSLDGVALPAGWPESILSFSRSFRGRRVLCRDCWFRLEPAFTCSGTETLRTGTVPVRIVSPFFTNEVLLSLVRFLKFGGGTPVAESLSWWMACALRCSCPGPSPERIVVPVPLHRSRERGRGYNQAALLARGVAADLDSPCCERVLVRLRKTRSQARLGEEARARNVRNAFMLAPTVSVAGKDVILVDDLVTSGWTVQWCAAALLAGAPRCVVVLSAGRRKDYIGRKGEKPRQAGCRAAGSP